jgi:hypothetical protein
MAAITLALSCSVARAHHPGGVGNSQGAGPINTISASTLQQGLGVAGITVDYQRLKGLSNQTLIEAAEHAGDDAGGHQDVHDLRTIQTYAFTYAYGVTNDLMLVASLPYVRRTGIREAHEEDDEFEVENLGPTDGIGDTTLLGQYRFFKGRGMETAVLLGLKAPTGKTNERSLEGETFDAEFQPGSGSWDGLLGIALTQRTGSLSFDANVLYTLVTEGTQETDLGDLLQYNVAISYRLASLGGSAQPMFNGGTHDEHGVDGHSHLHDHAHKANGMPALDLMLELNGQWSAEQETSGIKDRNSGGNTIFIAPGMRLSLNQWSGFVSFGVPIVDDLNGIQSESNWRITTGAAWAF